MLSRDVDLSFVLILLFALFIILALKFLKGRLGEKMKKESRGLLGMSYGLVIREGEVCHICERGTLEVEFLPNPDLIDGELYAAATPKYNLICSYCKKISRGIC